MSDLTVETKEEADEKKEGAKGSQRLGGARGFLSDLTMETMEKAGRRRGIKGCRERPDSGNEGGGGGGIEKTGGEQWVS